MTDNDANVTAGELADADIRPGYITVANVKPGVAYTVTEVEAPEGYFLPPAGCDTADDTDRCTTKTVGIGGNVTFSFVDEKKWAAPTVVKNATATYDVRYPWAIEKTVANPGGTPGASATQNVPEGTEATFDYGVTVTEKDKVESGWEVHGTVTVANTNTAPMTVTLTDVLSDGTVCTFPRVQDVSAAAGLQVSLPANAQTGYAYECTPEADAQDGTNTATVTWSLAAYPQTQAQVDQAQPGTDSASGTADYAFVIDDETNKTVTITDTQHQFDPAWVNTWGEGDNPETRNYSKSFPGVAGTCTTYDNTATITETGQSDSAQATVCVGKDLTVTKNKVASLIRTYAFDIDKAAADTTLDVDPETGKATASYTVTVTDGAATDSDWVMTGSIFVSNPNDWQAITLTGITDAYNGDAESCEVDTSNGLTIAKGETDKEFEYTCLFDDKPVYAGTNVATVTWDQAAASTPTGTASGSAAVVEADWDVDEQGRTVTVVDDKTVPGAVHTLGEVTWVEQGTEHELPPYSLELEGLPGQCVDYTNTATIEQTGQTAEETVTVCAPLGVTVEKTAGGTYDRTYKWLIDKDVDQTEVDIDGGDHTFNYTVTATPNGYVDGGWTMQGAITVGNPNTFKTMTVDITDVPSVGGGATCTVTDGEDVVIGKATLVDGKVVPAAETRDYSCTFTSEPSYVGGTNTARATWDGGSASSVPTAVPFTLDDETDKTVTVYDDKTQPGQAFLLGTASWDQPAQEFAYGVTKTGVAGECTTYDNTAVIDETGQEASASATLCVQSPLQVTKTVEASYDRTYLWTIQKSADRTRVEVAEGDTAKFTYTVKVDPTTYEDSGWEMGGTISVTNPNSAAVGAVTADITDLTDVGATCAVAGGEDVVIEPGEKVDLTYSCTFDEDGPSDYEGINTATATWTGNGGTRTATGSADVDFALDQSIDEDIDVYDTLDDATVAGAGSPERLGGANWFDGAREFTYSRNLPGVAGTCVDHDNVARIQQTGQTADETVTVCSEEALELEKTVTATFERTYHWQLDKVAAQLDDVEVTEGDTATFDYTVKATPVVPDDGEYDDHDFAMSGTITVTNPNDYEGGSITADVTDVPDVGDGVTCDVVDGDDVTIPADDSVTLDYECTITGRPDYTGTNVATATWTGPDDESRSASSDDESVDFEMVEEIDKTVTVLDDKTKPGQTVELGTATWNDDGEATTFTYQLPLTGTVGKCTDFVNTATVPLEGSPDLTDTATVTLCIEGDAVLANIVEGSFDRSYAWSIAKAADGTSYDVGDDGTARVSYTVNATPGAATDSGWTMSGALQVINPNAYKSLTVGLSTLTSLGGGSTCALTPGQDPVVPASGQRTYTYACTFTGQPAYSGTGTTTVTWDKGTVAISAPVTFALDQETDKVVDVVDDQTVPGQVVALGQATWNAEGTPTTFTYGLDLAADANECETYTNTAAIVQTAQTAQASVEVCGPEILPQEEIRPEDEVRPRPPVVIKGVEVLPSTGGPDGILLWSGVGLVLLGGGLLISRRRKLGA